MPFSLEQPFTTTNWESHMHHVHHKQMVRFQPRLPVSQVQGRAKVVAAAACPWPWRNLSGENSRMRMTKEVRQLMMPFAMASLLIRPAREMESHPVWHGVDLQESSSPQATACAENIEAAISAFKVQTPELLGDVLNCLVLAETVYKVQEGNHAEVASTITALREDFPAFLVSLERLQWSLPHVSHRYLLAENKDALYVSFIGTTKRRDIMTNANIMQETLWPDLAEVGAADTQDVPAAHTGFCNRARGVPIQALYKLARQRNKRLVLTGHSLGGAVALLCTLDLLHSLGDEADPQLACVGFATPAVGNAALAEHAKQKGWDRFITNYLVPEDVITRLLPSQQAAPMQSADQAAADQASGPAHPALWASLADQSSSLPSSTGPIGSTELVFNSPPACTASSPVSSLSLPDALGPLHIGAHHSSPVLQSRFRRARGGAQQLQPGRKLATQGRLVSASLSMYRPLPLRTSSPSSASTRQSMALPFAANNIVPLQAPAHHSRGSKLVYYTSLPSNSTVAVGSASSTDRSNIACTNSSDQIVLDTESSLISSEPQQQQQQQQSPANLPGRGIWNRTAQLARLVSFPMRATRAYYSYVPLGQQLYLNPQTVATSLQPLVQAAAPVPHPQEVVAAAVATAEEPAATESSAAALPSTEQVQSAAKSSGRVQVAAAVSDVRDIVVQQRREQLGRLWMHRMPTYRARFHQIFYAALSLPLPHLATDGDQLPGQDMSTTRGVALSRPIAPEVHVIRAETCARLLSPQHLKDMLQDGVTAVADQPSFRWFCAWSGAWPAICQRLYPRNQDTIMQITLHGHGFEHATSTQVTFAAETLTSHIVHQPQVVTHDLTWPNLGGCSILQSALAMFLVAKPAKEVNLEVVVPARLMRRAQMQLASTGILGFEVTVQSDFCSTTVPVSVHGDAQALQDSFAGMLAICRLVSAMLLRKSKPNDVNVTC